MTYRTNVRRTFRRTLVDAGLRTVVTDPRKRPVVPFRHALCLLLSIPLLLCRSLLELDQIARFDRTRRLFRSNRCPVISDSTLRRILDAIPSEQTADLLTHLLPMAGQEGLLRAKLAPGITRSMGVLDGSEIGKGRYTFMSLFGSICVPAVITTMQNGGDELGTAKEILRTLPERLGDWVPDLIVGDGLYFCEAIFRMVCDHLGKHMLVKYPDKGQNYRRRTLLHRAHNLFVPSSGPPSDAVRRESGYDYERLSRYEILATRDNFLGRDVWVLHTTERRTKAPPSEAPQRYWIVTTDTSLSLRAIREAAMLRWHIENDVFKRLSLLAGTKYNSCRDLHAATNLLRIVSTGLTLLTIVRELLARDTTVTQQFFKGAKRTWKAFCLFLTDCLSNSLVFT